MRGEVLHYDDGSGQGLISGDDGVRYAFRRSDLQQLQPVPRGARVDFVVKDNAATEIFLLVASASAPAIEAPPESTNEDLSLWSYFVKCLRLSFDADGRARRKEYWSLTLFSWLIVGALCTVIGVLAYYSSEQTDIRFVMPTIGFSVLLALTIMGLIPALFCVTIRRLHDIGLSGWWLLAGLLPYFGSIFLFVCSVIPSTRAVNKYGLFPKPL